MFGTRGHEISSATRLNILGNQTDGRASGFRSAGVLVGSFDVSRPSVASAALLFASTRFLAVPLYAVIPSEARLLADEGPAVCFLVFPSVGVAQASPARKRREFVA